MNYCIGAQTTILSSTEWVSFDNAAIAMYILSTHGQRPECTYNLCVGQFLCGKASNVNSEGEESDCVRHSAFISPGHEKTSNRFSQSRSIEIDPVVLQLLIEYMKFNFVMRYPQLLNCNPADAYGRESWAR